MGTLLMGTKIYSELFPEAEEEENTPQLLKDGIALNAFGNLQDVH